MSDSAKSKPYKVVYTVITRGEHRHWLRLGLAWPNADGSLTVRLDALPINGTLQIRDPPQPYDPTNSPQKN